MKNNSHFTGVVLVFCAIASFLVPTLSWLLSALGFSVNSILSDEGWRWLFQSGIHITFTYPVALLFCFITTYGSYQYAGFHLRNLSWRIVILLLFVTVLLLLPLVIAAVHPRSPLISLSGSIWPSPWLYGLPFIVSIEFVMVILVYCLLTQQRFSFSQISCLLVHGISRYGAWIIIASMLSFIYHCILYMNGHLISP